MPKPIEDTSKRRRSIRLDYRDYSFPGIYIVRSFKSIVARRAHKELRWTGPIWQRNYFERVLRDGKEFSDASRYIAENPMKWEWDRENPEFRTR